MSLSEPAGEAQDALVEQLIFVLRGMGTGLYLVRKAGNQR